MNIMSVVAGFLTGIAASMGLGGGFVLIIWLTVFDSAGQKAAGGINLLFFIPIALISIIIHTKNKLVEWRILPLLITAGGAGAVIGVISAGALNETVLQKCFAVLLLGVGIKEVFHKNNAEKNFSKALDK